MCVCVCVYVCMYVCVYFLIYLLNMLHYFVIIPHAAIYVLVSFAGDAVTSIMASVTAFPLQFSTIHQYNGSCTVTIRTKYIYIYIYPCYDWSMSIDFVKITNYFKCIVINSSLLTVCQFTDFRRFFLRISLCVWSNVHWLRKWSVVWSPLLQEHIAVSIILNRRR